MTGHTALISDLPISSETSAHGSVMAVYDSHVAAEEAIRALAKSGFDMRKLSIVGRDYSTEEGVVGYYNAGDRMKAWGIPARSGADSGACSSGRPVCHSGYRTAVRRRPARGWISGRSKGRRWSAG